MLGPTLAPYLLRMRYALGTTDWVYIQGLKEPCQNCARANLGAILAADAVCPGHHRLGLHSGLEGTLLELC